MEPSTAVKNRHLVVRHFGWPIERPHLTAIFGRCLWKAREFSSRNRGGSPLPRLNDGCHVGDNSTGILRLVLTDRQLHHLFIDTTTFTSEPSRRKTAFRIVTRLVASDQLTIHISEIVRREFLTRQQEQSSSAVHKVESALKYLLRRPLSEKLESQIRDAISLFHSMRSEALSHVIDEFDAWLRKHKVVVHEIEPSHGERVVARYFDGAAPFESAKSRKDFPDAFIFACLMDASLTYDHLHVVSSDGGFLDAVASEIPSATCYSSLVSFVGSDFCKALTRERIPEINRQAFHDGLARHKETLLESLHASLVDAIEGMTLEDLNYATIEQVLDFTARLKAPGVAHFGVATTWKEE